MCSPKTSRDNLLTVGIDASRCRSGGAKAHLSGILHGLEPEKFGIAKIHVWTYKSLSDILPESPWLVKHCPVELNRGLEIQLLWQAFDLSLAVLKHGCDILFTVNASTLCRFKPQIVLSQDMLSYEPGVMRMFGWTVARLRLLTILWIQNMAFRRADGVIFLTRYAAEVIQCSCGLLKKVAYAPHGIDKSFHKIQRSSEWPAYGERPIRCIYVSNTELYKHQWNVVKAIELLRKKKFNITLTLIGGGRGKAQKLLDQQLSISDPHGEFIRQEPFLPQAELPQHLANSDLFIFASSCENLPITLLEAMASGLPIACSDRGPMPEVLEDSGAYFDPENPHAIALALEKIITDDSFRRSISKRSKELSENYTWTRCADATWKFITEICRNKKF